MKTSISFISIILLFLLEGILCLTHAELNTKDVIREADKSRGNLEGVEWRIDIVSREDERIQKRVLKVKAREQNALAEFISPPKVKGRKLLMIDRNMWFIKPGLKKPVPISPRQKLMGGASYGDIASTNYAGDYEARPLPDETVDGELCFVFDLKATNKKTTYERIKYWVSKKRLVGVKAEFYTISGKMFKLATFEYKNRVQIEGRPHPFISKMVIVDGVIASNITTMIYSKAKIKKIPDSTFNLNLLMR